MYTSSFSSVKMYMRGIIQGMSCLILKRYPCLHLTNLVWIWMLWENKDAWWISWWWTRGRAFVQVLHMRTLETMGKKVVWPIETYVMLHILREADEETNTYQPHHPVSCRWQAFVWSNSNFRNLLTNLWNSIYKSFLHGRKASLGFVCKVGLLWSAETMQHR
jgi:hypothetical protein